jgi:hypothetical protein
MGSGVFVSYRKGDDPGWAGRVRDALARHFGDDRVFFDVDSIRGGQRWEEAIDGALSASGALVLVVGPKWLECLQERQAGPDTDYHLREITMALDKGIVVYPVRVRSATMPPLADLPEVLRDRLPAIQWTEIYEDMFGPCMERVVRDVEGAVGADAPAAPTRPAPGRRAPAAEHDPASLRSEVTVGPFGSDADFQEIADAVAAVASGGKVRVRPGRYLDQLVLDRPVAIVAEGKGTVLLDCDAVPCVRSSGDDVRIRGVEVRSSAQSRAEGIRVEAGDLTIEDVKVHANWVPDAVGIAVAGPRTRLVATGTDVTSVSVGIEVADGATARIERTTVTKATTHALLVRDGGDPKVSGCTFGSCGEATVRFEDGARGSIDDTRIDQDRAPAIAIASGSAPSIRGMRAPASALAGVGDRLVKAKGGRSDDDRPATGWRVLVDGGLGSVTQADVGELTVTGGGDPMVVGSSIALVRGEAEGRGTFERCQVGQVVLTSGADPTFRDGCTIAPDRGVKITVEVRDGALGTFEGCEIIGRQVRDGSADPAVASVGGSPTLRGCTIKNPGEGAVAVSAGGRVTLDGGEVRSSVSGPALTVDGGELVVTTGTSVRGGARVQAGRLTLQGVEIDADPVSGRTLEVRGSASCVATACTLRGPGFAAARKAGRWLEAQTGKVRGKETRIKGAAPPIEVGAGATATFDRCTLDDEPYPPA